MDRRTEQSLRAAEAALGLLGPKERASIERQAADDPELAAEHVFWTERFARLLPESDATPPPMRLKRRLEDELFGAPPSFFADLFAPEQRGLVMMILGTKLCAVALLLALFL